MDRTGQSTINTMAAEWVARRDAGLNAGEAEELEAWRLADARHAEALARYESVWAAAARPRQAGVQQALGAEIAAAGRRQRRRHMGGGVLLILLALGLTGIWQVRRSAPAPTMSASARLLLPQRQTLPDGSRIERPAGAELTVDIGERLRRVVLQRGEAHFEVAHDPARPFVVEVAGVEIRAVGTAFAVQLGRKVHVLVTEGRVAVEKPRRTDAPPSGEPAVPVAAKTSSTIAHVSAGHELEFEPSAEPLLRQPVALPAGEIAERLAWRHPRVEFSRTPLREALAVVNRENRVQFVIVDPSLASIPLSGLIRIDDPETLQHLLKSGFGIEAERVGDEIRLKARAAR